MLAKNLDVRQADMRDRNTGKILPPVVFATSLAPALLAALKACRSAKEDTLAAMASAIPTAIRFIEAVITAESSSPEDRTQAANTILFLMTALMRQERTLARAATRKEEAVQKRIHHQSKVERAKADAAGVVIKIAKERKRIQRVLDKATQEQKGVIDAR